MSTHDAILSLLAERDAGRAELADCECHERAAVERAEALANAIDCHVSLTAQGRGGGTSLLRAALVADDEARAT